MGLSASQARLLNLTNRMHQIEYNASRIEAMKLQMANESRRVYEDYLEALDQAKIQKKTLTTNGAVTFVDIKDYDDFVNAGFKIVVHGLPDTYTPQVESDAHKNWAESKPDASDTSDTRFYTVDNSSGTPVYTFDQDAYNSAVEDWENNEPAMYTDGAPISTTNNSQICNDKDELKEAIKQIFKGVDGQGVDILEGLNKNFEETLTNLINSGVCTIVERVKDPSKYGADEIGEDGFPTDVNSLAFKDHETSVATNTSLQEVTDEVKLRKAEAKYEADMKRIDMKDRRYDSDLAALDNERNAIKQEMETLKTVARDNVDRTFKIFS